MASFIVKFQNAADLNWAYGNLKKLDYTDGVHVDECLLRVKRFNTVDEVTKILQCLNIEGITVVKVPEKNEVNENAQ